MKLETSWNSCEFCPENEKEAKLLSDLYQLIKENDGVHLEKIDITPLDHKKKEFLIYKLYIETYF